jgi:hypothetical protein
LHKHTSQFQVLGKHPVSREDWGLPPPSDTLKAPRPNFSTDCPTSAKEPGFLNHLLDYLGSFALDQERLGDSHLAQQLR